MQRNEKHDKNLPHLSPWLGSGFGGPLWKATWLPVQVVQGGMHARAKDMTGPEYLLERALTKRFLRFAAFLAFLRLDFISFRNEVRSWVSFLISSWMTSWQQERTPKGGPDLGSISGTGTNGLDSACFDNDASKASIYCTNCARVRRNILGRVSPPIFGKEPLAQIFIRHDCRNFWLLDPAELLEQSGRQTLLVTQNTRALKGMAPLLQRHGFNDTCNNFRPHQNSKPPARCPRLFLSPSLLHKAFEPCKIVCVAWLKRRRHSRWHIDQPQSQAMSKSE